MHGAVLRAVGQGLAFAIVMLSLVLLIGYAGPDLAGAARVRGTGACWRRRGCRVSWARRRSGWWSPPPSPVWSARSSRFRACGCATSTSRSARWRSRWSSSRTCSARSVDSRPTARRSPGGARSTSDKAYFVAIAAVFVLLAWLVDRAATRRVRAPAPGDEGQPGCVHDARARPDPHQGGGLRPGGGDRRGRWIPDRGVEGHGRQGRLQPAHRRPLRVAACSCSPWSAGSPWCRAR